MLYGTTMGWGWGGLGVGVGRVGGLLTFICNITLSKWYVINLLKHFQHFLDAALQTFSSNYPHVLDATLPSFSHNFLHVFDP